MTITLTPKVESALIEQARQRDTTPEQLALDGLRYLFATPEPSEEEEDYYRVQAQFLLAQMERLMEEVVQDDHDPEARRKEREAERAAMSEDTRRLLDQASLLGQPNSRYAMDEEEAAKADEEREQELEALRLEHKRLCAEASVELGWLFGKAGIG